MSRKHTMTRRQRLCLLFLIGIGFCVGALLVMAAAVAIAVELLQGDSSRLWVQIQRVAIDVVLFAWQLVIRSWKIAALVAAIAFTLYSIAYLKNSYGRRPTGPTKPFVSDGCSGFMSFIWRFVVGEAPPWEGSCLEHDRAYHAGGDLKLRLAADSKLMQEVAAKGHPYWAWVMFLGVRIGGVYFLPFPSIRRVDGHWKFAFDGVRWGYGWKYPRFR